MAVLTNSDLTAYKRALRQDPVARAELRLETLSKSQLLAVMQAIEDRFEGARATIKADMDTAAGHTLTANMAKKFIKVWMQNKFGGE